MIKIGNISLEYGLILAPMAGVTDRAFRTVCKDYGAELLVTEMVSAKAIHYGDSKTASLYALDNSEFPAAVQIFGSDPDIMAESAKFLSELENAPSIIDINMGCPVKKIVSNGEGSALMRDIKKAAEIVTAVKKAVSIPVTVKMRAGWNSENINASELAVACEYAGADAVCVHGRTREQMYEPPVDLTVIRDVKKAVKIPVIGNGGIFSAEDAEKMLEFTECDALMIARGAMGQPWLFSDIIAKFSGNKSQDHDVINCMRKHLSLLIEDKGEKVGVPEARRHMSYYIKGIRGAASMRGELHSAQTVEDITSIIDRAETILSQSSYE